MDQLDALAIGAGASPLDGQRAIEIVDDEQQLLQQIGHRLVGLLAAFAFDAPAIVVELGALASNTPGVSSPCYMDGELPYCQY